MALPDIVKKQEYFIDGIDYQKYPEYFKEINDPDIEDVYIPSKKPKQYEDSESHYWPILHFHRSKTTGKTYRVIALGHCTGNDKLRNLFIEIKNKFQKTDNFNNVNKAREKAYQYKVKYLTKLMHKKAKNILSNMSLLTNQIVVDDILNYPDMVVTADNVFEMYTVCVQNTNTWPTPIILDKWYYTVKQQTCGYDHYVQSQYNTIFWALEKHKFDCFNHKLINVKPLSIDINTSSQQYNNLAHQTCVPYQFCSLDDAEQFAYSYEYIMETHHAHTHTELLHRLKIDEIRHKYLCLFPVGCCPYTGNDHTEIDYDKTTNKWILVKQSENKQLLKNTL